MNGIAHNYRFLSIDYEIYVHKQGQTILLYLKILYIIRRNHKQKKMEIPINESIH
jgi:hypothetical protein